MGDAGPMTTPPQRYLPFSRVEQVESTPTGLLAHVRALPGVEGADLGAELLSIEPVRSDVVRLRLSRAGRFDEQPTHAVCVDPLADQPPFRVQDRRPERAEVTLSTDDLVVTLGLDPFRLDVSRPDGTSVLSTVVDEQGRPWTYATLNDAFVMRRQIGAGDAVYGLGEKTGAHNRRGRAFTMWNLDVLSPDDAQEFVAGLDPQDPRADVRSTEYDPYYLTIPFFQRRDAGTGAVSASFLDNAYRSHFDFTGESTYQVHVDGGQWTEYVFAGPTMARVLQAYTWLTGRMAPPPLWALGYHQCRWQAYDQDSFVALGTRHRDLGIPCDVLWLDIDYMDGFRVFTWDENAYPDPPAMLSRLADDGFRVISIIDPGVKVDPGYPVYDEALRRDVLCRTEGGQVYVGQVWPGITAFPDFATEQARNWWGDLNAAHVASGLAGIWNDMNEPATGWIRPERMRFDHGTVSHERFHNQYALLMAMGTTAGLRRARPDLRPFVLSRSGFAGIQRYAANWMGDNQSRWDHLRLSIAMGMGMGLSGQPFVGADIGGFAGDCDGELLLRWTQYGVLTPFARNHAMLGTAEQYPWSFGPQVLEGIRAAVTLRYRLLPYLYASFLAAAQTGAPIQRPLVFDHQDDPAVVDLDDEYLLGSDLLVAPVTEPGMTQRPVYLPAGRWYDWSSGEVTDGPATVTVATWLDGIPLFARGGAVLPLWPQAPQSTAGHHPQVVELHVFVPADDGARHDSVLQEDDGLTTAAQDGARVRTTFALRRTGGSVEVVADVDGDGFPQFARTTFRVVLHGARPDEVTVDGQAVPAPDGTVEIANAGTGFRLSFPV